MMHPSTMELQTLADGERRGTHDTGLLAHLQLCEQCQRALAELRDANERDAESLRLLDCRLPTVDVDAVIASALARRRAPRFRAAIAAGIGVVMVAAAAAAAVPGAPLHSFMVGLLARTTSVTTPGASPAARGASAPQPAPAAGVAFPPGARVEIVFAHAEATGRMRIRMANTPMVRVTSRSGTAAYQLTGGGVTIDSVQPNASFEVVLPRTATRVVVRVGARAVFSRDGARLSTSGVADSSGAFVIPLLPTR